MEGHEEGGPTSKAEHWTANMPDHILDNKVGPTAPFDSPAPKATAGDATDSSKDEDAKDAKKKEEAAAQGKKAADAAAAAAKADPKTPAPAQVAKE